MRKDNCPFFERIFMSDLKQVDYSGLICLKALLAQTRRNVNFMALVTQDIQTEYQKDSMSVLLKISGDQQLRPETVERCQDLALHAGGG